MFKKIICFLPLVVLGLGLAAFEYPEDLTAVVSAYSGELESVRTVIEDEEILHVESVNGIEFTFARIGGKSVVFFQTNISTVNAAMNTQLVISKYGVDRLLFSGIAGGLNPVLKKGDISIPQKWTYHTQGAYFNDGYDPNKGHAINFTFHDVEPFGIFYPAPVYVARKGQSVAEPQFYFEVDSELMDVASQAIKNLNLLNADGAPAKIKLGGIGVTGPVFMDNREYRSWLFEEWGADCVEMESAAIAQVCWANEIPFLIVRAMSDLAGGQEGENDIYEFAKAAEDNSAKVVKAILSGL